MTYIENVFLCMASPLLIAALCMGKRQRKFFLFCFAGMGVCLLSAYINTFFAALYKADTFAATTEIAPVVEEVMKLLPLLFYLLIFEPKREQIKNNAVVIALSFATFENVCYLIQNGAGHFSFIFFRGIGTGAMHVICGAIVGGGLAYVCPYGIITTNRKSPVYQGFSVIWQGFFILFQTEKSSREVVIS